MWSLVAGEVPLLWVVVIAFAISGVASYFLLNRQREAFARRVDERARRATERFEADEGQGGRRRADGVAVSRGGG